MARPARADDGIARRDDHEIAHSVGRQLETAAGFVPAQHQLDPIEGVDAFSGRRRVGVVGEIRGGERSQRPVLSLPIVAAAEKSLATSLLSGLSEGIACLLSSYEKKITSAAWMQEPRKPNIKEPLTWGIALVAFAVVAFLGVSAALIVVAAGLLGVILLAPASAAQDQKGQEGQP